MTAYYTIVKRRGERTTRSRILDTGFIAAIKDTAEFKELVEIITEALRK